MAPALPRSQARRGGERDWFQRFQSFVHTIDILPYARYKCYTVRRYIIAAYGIQRNSLNCTHPAPDLKL